VGAKNSDILNQFLVEAVIITVLGGVIGVVVGLVLSLLGTIALQTFGGITDWHFFIPYGTISIAFIVCVVVGLIFGLYPARQASKKNPIEALRYE